MKKIIDYIKENINTLWLMCILLYMFVGSILTLYGVIKLEMYANLFYTFNIFTMLLVFKNKQKESKNNIIDILIIILSIISVITTIYSKYKNVSMWGQTSRYEGLLMLLNYYFIYLLSTFVKDNNRKKLIYLILFLGVVQVVFGVLQQYKIMPIVSDGTNYSGGLVGNSNFFGTQNVIWLSLSLGLFIFGTNWFNEVLIFIFGAGLSLSGAMSGFVGLIAVLISIIIILILKRKYINIKLCVVKFIITIFLIAGSFLVVNNVTDTSFFNDIKSLFAQSTDIVVNNNFDDSYGTNRLYIWKSTIPKIKDNLFLGVGIDSFKYAFNPPLLLPSGIVTKAHNEYLQILITEGIFALITYLLLIVITIIQNIKRSENTDYNYVNYAIVLSVVGYLVQAFFNISVIRVAPLFYLLLGLCYNRCKKEV